MKKAFSKVGLCAAIVIGSMGHQAFAVESVHQGVTITGSSTVTSGTATTQIVFPNLTKTGQYHWLHALTITNNNNKNGVSVTIMRGGHAVTGLINVAAGDTKQIMFTDGFEIRNNEIMEVQF